MPYPEPGVSNEHFFTYKGVDIYIERRDHHSQEPLLQYHYSTSPVIQGPESFDVRDLDRAVRVPPDKNPSEREIHKSLIMSAIDDGALPGLDGPPPEDANIRHAIRGLLKAKSQYWNALNHFEDETGVEVDTELEASLSHYCDENPSEAGVDAVLEKVKEKRS